MTVDISRDALSIRILIIVCQAQSNHDGRGIELGEIIGHFTRGAIGRRMAPDRRTVIECIERLMERAYVRVDRWSKYRLTLRGWAEGMQYPAEAYPWED
jgi:hypothetical protein